MFRFAIQKIVQGVFLLLVVSFIGFATLSFAGGDALTALSENPQVSRETIERLRAVYSVDEPLSARYLTWLGRSVRGDLGESFVYRIPVMGLVISRLANTGLLAVMALGIALLVTAPIAIWPQAARRRLIDRAVDIFVSIFASTPRIVAALAALLFIVFLSDSTGQLDQSPIVLITAAFVLALPLIAVLLAQTKSELSRASKLAFVQFARSKGLSERAVTLRHAIREALNPIITVLGLSIGSLVSGSVVVETVLGWPGIGALMVTAVRGRDVSLVMGVLVVTSIAVWIGNSLAEVLQLVNDPRLRDAEMHE